MKGKFIISLKCQLLKWENKLEGSIFITGIHRSGTSWIAKILESGTSYLIKDEEIFNPETPLQKTPITRFYQHVGKYNENNYSDFIDSILKHQYSFLGALYRIRNVRNLLHIIKKKTTSTYRNLFKQDSKMLIVEPIGLLATEWFANKYNCQVLIVVRHPAAIISSMKRLNWKFNFDWISTQPMYLNKYMDPLRDELLNPPLHDDIIGQGILVWKILHNFVAKMEDRHANWIIVKYEDLAGDPMKGFKELYGRLNLCFTDKVEQSINYYCSNNNPSELPLGQRENNKRNSFDAMMNWKKRLDPDEIKRIYDSINSFSSRWYAEKDW